MSCSTTPCFTIAPFMLHHVMSCYAMLCYVVLRYVMQCYVVLCAVVVCYATHQRNSRPPDHQTTRPPDHQPRPPDHQTTRPPDHPISSSLCNSLGRTTRPRAQILAQVEDARWADIVRTPIGLGSNFWGKTSDDGMIIPDFLLIIPNFDNKHKGYVLCNVLTRGMKHPL